MVLLVVVLVPVGSVNPIGMAIPSEMLPAPLTIALFWMPIAVAIIRMIFWRAVTVVVTLRLPQSGASKNIAPTMSATI